MKKTSTESRGMNSWHTALWRWKTVIRRDAVFLFAWQPEVVACTSTPLCETTVSG